MAARDMQTDRETHRQTAVTTIHSASFTTHAKCTNYLSSNNLPS